MYLEEGSWILAIETTNMHWVFHLTTVNAYGEGKNIHYASKLELF